MENNLDNLLAYWQEMIRQKKQQQLAAGAVRWADNIDMGVPPTQNTTSPITAFYQSRITIKAYKRRLFILFFLFFSREGKNIDLKKKREKSECLDKTWGKIHNLSLYYHEIQAV